jgi:putative ATPase
VSLFDHALRAQLEKEAPLAHRMRPRSLDDFVGQEHIVGPGRLLRRAIQADQLSSIIFCGPPGTGKTTLASVIAQTTQSHFVSINAVLAGVKEIREAIDGALERRKLHGMRTTLFVDEVHRWNKAQQDALLPHVENGTIILIGATTENPYFEVNKALVSRSRIFQLRPLTEEHLKEIARRAIADPERGYGKRAVQIEPAALAHLVDVANGDARGVLNALELAVETTPPDDLGAIKIGLAVAEESIQRRAVLYDKDGDVHYDTISAFIKSVRGSDPDAALYWMARMVYAGEDARFLFRRMAILASEDVGLADPNAAAVVAGCWDLYEKVGMPEGRFHLAQACLYLSTAPKSNSTMGFFDALAAVEREAEADVPNHIKDASRDAEGFGHGQGYIYPHAYRDHWVAQQYLPGALAGRIFYDPSEVGHERQIHDDVQRRREAQVAGMLAAADSGPTEILTTGPRDRKREAWLARTVASASRSLERVRDRLFERARIARHHLVLVLSETTGLLAFESLRQAPEGGVWVQATEASIAEMVRERTMRLPEIERPHVFTGPLTDLDPDMRFDRILALNAASRGGEVKALATIARARLTESGRLCLAQAVPRRGQRLSALIAFPSDAAGLAERVRAAEEALYADAADPLTGWDVGDLTAALEGEGLAVDAQVEASEAERLITPQQLETWLPAKKPSDASYAARLVKAGLSADDLAAVSALYREQLSRRTVRWTSTVVHLTVTAPRSP